MGLDMFLEMRKKEQGKNFKQVVKELNDLDYSTWKQEHIELAYWRKANQIHLWFVQNVQNGNDDCGDYQVKKDDLEKLLNICVLVKKEFTKSKKVLGKVKNGQIFKDGVWVDMLEDGDVFEGLNYEKIKKLLPTQEGFFFGNTDIDVWYYEDIQYTIKTLKKILRKTNFDDNYIWYNSSW